MRTSGKVIHEDGTITTEGAVDWISLSGISFAVEPGFISSQGKHSEQMTIQDAMFAPLVQGGLVVECAGGLPGLRT